MMASSNYAIRERSIKFRQNIDDFEVILIVAYQTSKWDLANSGCSRTPLIVTLFLKTFDVTVSGADCIMLSVYSKS